MLRVIQLCIRALCLPSNDNERFLTDTNQDFGENQDKNRLPKEFGNTYDIYLFKVESVWLQSLWFRGY